MAEVRIELRGDVEWTDVIGTHALGRWYRGECEARLTWHGTVWAGISVGTSGSMRRRRYWMQCEWVDRKRYERRYMMKIRCEGEMLRTRWLSPPVDCGPDTPWESGLLGFLWFQT
jgi:hypothetical protein